jgi:hypothetical protein
MRLLKDANRIGDEILSPLSADEQGLFLGLLKRLV